MDKLVNKLVVLLICLSGFSYSKGQSQTLLDQRVSASVTNQTLESGLLEIEEAAHISFSYNPVNINVDSLVSFAYSQERLEDVIHDLLGESVKTRVVGTVIILRFDEKKKKEKVYTHVYGSVTDVLSGSPLPDVVIFNVDGKSFEISDSTGQYNIEVESKSPQIELSFNLKSHKDTVLVVPSGAEIRHDIALKPNYLDSLPKDLAPKEVYGLDSGLSEVAIVEALVPKDFSSSIDQLYGYYEPWPAQISLLPFIGTSGKQNAFRINKFSVNVFAGYSAGVDGIEIGGFANINRKLVRGMQMAGFANVNGGDTYGLQLSGYTNITMNGMYGLQMSGFVNTVGRYMEGTQMAGFVNIAGGIMEGTQLAGFVNVTGTRFEGTQLCGFVNANKGTTHGLSMCGYVNINGEDLFGTQITGFVNVVGRDALGTQLSGFVNLTGQNMEGAQLTGFVNVCGGRMKGAQICGMLNLANEVDGLQFALVNINDTMRGVPIGIFSYSRKGFHSLGLQHGDLVPTQFQFKTGVKHLYNVFSVGYDPQNDFYSLGFGYGSRWDLFRTRKWDVSAEGMLATYDLKLWSKTVNLLATVDLKLDYDIARNFTVSVGPSFKWFYNYDGLTPHSLSTVKSKEVYIYTREYWIGYRGAIAFNF